MTGSQAYFSQCKRRNALGTVLGSLPTDQPLRPGHRRRSGRIVESRLRLLGRFNSQGTTELAQHWRHRRHRAVTTPESEILLSASDNQDNGDATQGTRPRRTPQPRLLHQRHPNGLQITGDLLAGGSWPHDHRTHSISPPRIRRRCCRSSLHIRRIECPISFAAPTAEGAPERRLRRTPDARIRAGHAAISDRESAP